MGIDTLIPQLKESLTESVENKRIMEESYNKKDNINYEIVVHKLKSESRMLGLTGLGEMFYNHELAAKRKDWDYINKEYTPLISEYDKVLNVLEKLQKMNIKKCKQIKVLNCKQKRLKSFLFI